jgi:hypothetical protein
VNVPELASPTYRNRVRNLSSGNRNSGVQHLPGSHTRRCAPISRTNHGQTIKVLQGTFPAYLPLMFGVIRDRFPGESTRRAIAYLSGHPAVRGSGRAGRHRLPGPPRPTARKPRPESPASIPATRLHTEKEPNMAQVHDTTRIIARHQPKLAALAGPRLGQPGAMVGEDTAVARRSSWPRPKDSPSPGTLSASPPPSPPKRHRRAGDRGPRRVRCTGRPQPGRRGSRAATCDG